jgi:hypothetical protein
MQLLNFDEILLCVGLTVDRINVAAMLLWNTALAKPGTLGS